MKVRIAGVALFAGLLLPPQRGYAMEGGNGQSADHSTPVAQVPEKKEEVRDENYEYTHSPAVQKFGAAIGLKPDQAATAFMVLNFLLLAAGVGYGLAKGLPKTFRNRSTAIQKGLVDARTATEEARTRLSAVETRLAKLDEQIAGMRKQAETDALREEQKLKEAVDEQKKKIVADAETEIAAASSAARRDLQKYAAELAITQAARKLEVTAATDKLLVESFASRLSSKGEN
jgi:F-type H+-transporting ATPase subunit b